MFGRKHGWVSHLQMCTATIHVPHVSTLTTHATCCLPCLHPPPPLRPTQLCMATVYSLLYGSLGRKITGEEKTA